jgi:hypothetical protein
MVYGVVPKNGFHKMMGWTTTPLLENGTERKT